MPASGITPEPKSANCSGTDRSSTWRRSVPPNGEPIIPAKIGTAQKRAPRMKATVTFEERSEATIPIEINIAPISQYPM